MNEDSEPLVFTVESEGHGGKTALRAARIVFRVVGIVCLSMSIAFVWLPDDKFDPTWIRYLFFVTSTAAAAVLFAVPMLLQRGTWKISESGVAFQSLKGKEKVLAWKDVEAVYLLQDLAPSFRGPEVKITLQLQHANQDVRTTIRQFIESQLGDEFDLRPRPQVKFTSGRCVKLVVIAVACTTISLGGPFLLQHFLVELLPPWILALLTMVWVFLPTVILVVLVTLYERSTPYWRERGVRYDSLDN